MFSLYITTSILCNMCQQIWAKAVHTPLLAKCAALYSPNNLRAVDTFNFLIIIYKFILLVCWYVDLDETINYLLCLEYRHTGVNIKTENKKKHFQKTSHFHATAITCYFRSTKTYFSITNHTFQLGISKS